MIPLMPRSKPHLASFTRVRGQLVLDGAQRPGLFFAESPDWVSASTMQTPRHATCRCWSHSAARPDLCAVTPCRRPSDWRVVRHRRPTHWPDRLAAAAVRRARRWRRAPGPGGSTSTAARCCCSSPAFPVQRCIQNINHARESAKVLARKAPNVRDFACRVASAWQESTRKTQ